jgi:methyl-accepting chemotaxis protein
VRTLAQRSSQAAKDIKDLITNSNNQVKDGVDLVSKAGGALTEIVKSIKAVSVVVAEIASASVEQASGIEQVNKALAQMDEVTQQNSALVEENAATAKTLEHQANAMDQRVAVFQVADMAGPERSDSPAAQDHKPTAVAAKPRADARAKQQPAATPQRMPKRAAAGGGPVGRMQTALATAVNAEPEWKQF